MLFLTRLFKKLYFIKNHGGTMNPIKACSFFLLILCNNIISVTAKTIDLKPKKLLSYHKGGNGHTAACSVLKDVLYDFDIKAVNVFTDVIHSFDFIKTISMGKTDGEGFYNYLLQRSWGISTLNFIIRYPAQWIFNWNQKNYEKQFVTFLNKEKPDLLISIMPLINGPAYRAAQKCKIPFLLITLDADLTLWLQGLKKTSYDKFRIAIKTLTPRISSQLASKKIPQNNLRITGSPLRRDFLEPKDTRKILDDWNLPVDKPIISLFEVAPAQKSFWITQKNY
jgi:hypothetical protein